MKRNGDRIDISAASFQQLMDCMLSSSYISKHPNSEHELIRQLIDKRYEEGMNLLHPL